MRKEQKYFFYFVLLIIQVTLFFKLFFTMEKQQENNYLLNSSFQETAPKNELAKSRRIFRDIYYNLAFFSFFISIIFIYLIN